MRQAQWMALLATALVAVFGVGTARADWQTGRAQAIAATLWHDPCGGKVTLDSAPPPDPGWRAWTYRDGCTIVLSNVRPWKWEELCPVLMHEYGHLAGYTDPANPADPHHSHDPDDIMWPVEHYDARCDGYGAAFLGATGGVGRAASTRRRAKARARSVKARRAARRAGRTAA
jgi:hypothetical protein